MKEINVCDGRGREHLDLVYDQVNCKEDETLFGFLIHG